MDEQDSLSKTLVAERERAAAERERERNRKEERFRVITQRQNDVSACRS